MPKRGGGRGNYGSKGGGFRNNNQYADLDDSERIERERERRLANHDISNLKRKVHFKPQLSHIKGRISELAIRTRLEEDEDMGDFASTSKFDRYGGPRRKGSPIPKGKFVNFGKLVKNTFGWYQVSIKGGQRYSKDDVIRALLNAMTPDIFIPHYWRTEKHGVLFFVDDFNAAQRMQQIDRVIQMPDGYRLYPNVRGSFPIVSVDEPFKERMKLVMAKRYNANTKALDLSNFHADPGFKDMFCGLLRTPVMAAALEIIEKNIPDLEALNLNDNHISSLESFKNIQQRIPHLKILYLENNRIGSLAHLFAFHSVPIVELVLKGNPLCSRYKEKSVYISEVRRKFPKIQKLDGEILEPQILFDVTDTTSLPKPKASFLCDPSGTDIIRQFVEQYFMIFDSDDRQPLLNAYHEQAMLSVSIPPASQAGRLASFWKYNRNLKRIMNNEEAIRIRQLKVGRLSVVSTLAEWPKTQHDIQSFSVDLTLFTPKLISFCVAGLFKELDTASTSSGYSSNQSAYSNDVRYFQRLFVIVPAGGGFCIRNEMVFITSASHNQARSFLKSRNNVNSPSATITTATSLSAPAGSLESRLQQFQSTTTVASIQAPDAMLQSTTVKAQPDETTQLQMVQAMSSQSAMNLEWSRKCLEETNWNFNNAAFIFDKLHKENKIPPEAFTK